MKFYRLFRNVLVAGFGVALATACTKQEPGLLPAPANTLSVSAARSWYEASHPLVNPKGAASAQADTSISRHWALNWARAIPLPGPKPLVLVPLQGDAQRFTGRLVQGTRYLVVARDTNSLKPTGLIVELLLNHSITPVDTAALLVSFYRSYQAAGTPTAPAQGTGLVLFYTDVYRYRTGRRFENGIVQPGVVHLGFRTRKDPTAVGRGSKPAGPTGNYDSVVCTDWYYVNEDGSRGDYITTTGDCSGPPGSGGTGTGPYGGYGDGGWGGEPGGGGSSDPSSGDPGSDPGLTTGCRACPNGTTPTPASFPTSVIISSSVSNDPKAKCVLTKLQDNSQFKELMTNFQNSSRYNVSFNMGTIASGSTGNCTWNYATSTATILINKSAFDLQHAIWGATTFFHETYHAQLQQYAIATFGTTVISNWPKPINDMTFQELIGYVDATAGANAQWTTATHNYMAYNNSIMAEGLRNFVQTNYPQTYAQIGSDIAKYNYLSLMGLENTTRFRDEVTSQGKDADYRQAISDFITSELPDCL
ncbi:hypothetical protein GCM10027044_20010 [Hymenobacter ruber]